MNNIKDAIKKSSIILLSCDNKGTILLHEGGGLDYHNIQPNEYIGKNAFEVFLNIPDYLQALKQSLNGKTSQVVYKWGADYCETHITPLENGGAVSICTIQTERILKEKEDNLQDQIFAKEDAKRDFLAIISHELRTPLTGLIGIINLMKDNSEPKTIKNDKRRANPPDTFVKILDKTANKLMTLVNDLLDYSKITKNKIVIQNKSYNIQELVSDSINLFTANAKDKNICIESKIESKNSGEDFVQYYVGDSTRISQILNNLLGNAIKFSNENDKIIIKYYHYNSTTGSKLCFEIQDNGIGIKESEKYLLFQDYSQLPNELTEKSVGTGLGLFISKKLANAMNGDVIYKPNYPKGSIFILEIPFNPDLNNLKKFEHFSNNVDTLFKWKDTTILIAEDSHAMQLVTQKYLHKLGFSNIEICSNGKIALEKLKNKKYDYVFLDNLMHGITGVEIAKELKLFNNKPITVWMSSSELIHKELFDKNLQKPFTLNDLKNIMI
jgi:signal transduction histidine kinase